MLPTSKAIEQLRMASQRFVVRALDTNQQIVEVVVEALDVDDLLSRVRAMSLSVLTHRQASTSWRDLTGWRKSSFDLLLFVQEINALITAGLSITEAIETLLERSSMEANRLIVQRLLNDLKAGLRLSQALERQSAVFPPLLVGIVQSSEDTSDLPRALERYLQYELQLRSLRQKITSAAIYPAILMSVGTLVALFLLGYVVPRFASVYQGGGRELPAASQWLLLLGQWIAAHRTLALITLAITVATIAWWLVRLGKTNEWWRFLRFVPGAAQRLEILELSRLYLTLSMLLQGGLPIDRSMRLASSVLSVAKQSKWESVRVLVNEGIPLTNAMEQYGFCTNVATRMLRVGERSGQIGAMLGKAANFYEAETARRIDTFSKTFEPVLMAAIGIVIGVIVILLYIPVFDLAGSIK
jgi:general secretion pathway protein F